MIKTFKHDGLEKFFRNGSKAGIQPAHEKKLRLQLDTLDDAERASAIIFLVGDCTLFNESYLEPGR